MSAARIHELALVAQQAGVHAAGVAEAADRGWTDPGDVSEALARAATLRRELADALSALAQDAPAEHGRLVAQLRESLGAHAGDDARTAARAQAWLDAGAPPDHRDTAWAIVWLLGT